MDRPHGPARSATPAKLRGAGMLVRLLHRGQRVRAPVLCSPHPRSAAAKRHDSTAAPAERPSPRGGGRRKRGLTPGSVLPSSGAPLPEGNASRESNTRPLQLGSTLATRSARQSGSLRGTGTPCRMAGEESRHSHLSATRTNARNPRSTYSSARLQGHRREFGSSQRTSVVPLHLAEAGAGHPVRAGLLDLPMRTAYEIPPHLTRTRCFPRSDSHVVPMGQQKVSIETWRLHFGAHFCASGGIAHATCPP